LTETETERGAETEEEKPARFAAATTAVDGDLKGKPLQGERPFGVRRVAAETPRNGFCCHQKGAVCLRP